MAGFLHQPSEVEGVRGHRDFTVALAPLAPRPISVQLESIPLRVLVIERLAHKMVRRTHEEAARSGGLQGEIRAPESAPVGKQEGQVVEPARPLRRLGRARIGCEHEERMRVPGSPEADETIGAGDGGEPEHSLPEGESACQAGDSERHRSQDGRGLGAATPRPSLHSGCGTG